MQSTKNKNIEYACEVYGDSGTWLKEEGIRHHGMNVQIVRRFKLTEKGWQKFSTDINSIH